MKPMTLVGAGCCAAAVHAIAAAMTAQTRNLVAFRTTRVASSSHGPVLMVSPAQATRFVASGVSGSIAINDALPAKSCCSFFADGPGRFGNCQATADPCKGRRGDDV
jgi:hypothetical protein